MAVPALARVFFLILLLAACTVEAFVATAVRAPRLSRASSLIRAEDHQLTRTRNSALRSCQAPALAMSSSSYEQSSSELSGGGDVGGSTEMELQELIVDFTDDGRILLEVKGVKVGCATWIVYDNTYEHVLV